MHRGGGPAGARLQGLRTANLAAVSGHCRIVGHVLRLEGQHFEAAPREGAAQTRHQQAFANIRAGALKHQCFCAQNSIPTCALTPAAK